MPPLLRRTHADGPSATSCRARTTRCASRVEVKGFTHAKGDTRPEWSAANAVRTLNIPIRGRFVLLFPDHEVLLEKEGDFVRFGPGIAHSFRSEEPSLVLTVR